jgi:hypothetical protein
MAHPVHLEYLLGPFIYANGLRNKQTSGSIDMHRNEVVVTTLETTKYVSALRRSILQTLYGIDIITLLRGTQSAPVVTLANFRLKCRNTVVLPLFPDTRVRTVAAWFSIDKQCTSRRD